MMKIPPQLIPMVLFWDPTNCLNEVYFFIWVFFLKIYSLMWDFWFDEVNQESISALGLNERFGVI